MGICIYLSLLIFVAACSNSSSSSGGSDNNFQKLEKITPELTQTFKDFSYTNVALGRFIASSISHSSYGPSTPQDIRDNCAFQFGLNSPGATAIGISSSVIKVSGQVCPIEINYERGTVPATRSEIMKWNGHYIFKDKYQQTLGVRQVDEVYEVSFSALQNMKVYTRAAIQKYQMQDGSKFQILLSGQKQVNGDTKTMRYILQNSHSGNAVRVTHVLSFDKDENIISNSEEIICEFNDKTEPFKTCQESGVFSLVDIGSFTTSYRIFNW